jgi:hypothetical protein
LKSYKAGKLENREAISSVFFLPSYLLNFSPSCVRPPISEF